MAILCGLVGLLTGALLNLAADRFPDRGPSSRLPFCPYCGQQRPPSAWISILAYLRLSSDCRSCAAPISLRHPLVELLVACLFVLLWVQWGWSPPFVLYGTYTALLILVAVVDVEHRLIPNAMLYPALGLALVGAVLYPPAGSTRSALLGGIMGFGLLLLVYLAGQLFVRILGKFRGRPANHSAFGLGDVRLGTVIGLIVGLPAIFQTLLLTAILGGVAAALYWLVCAVGKRRYTPFTTIPLAPYFVAGALLTLFLGPVIPSLPS